MRIALAAAVAALTIIQTVHEVNAQNVAPPGGRTALHEEDALCITLTKHGCEVNLPKAECAASKDLASFYCGCGGKPSDTIEIKAIEVFDATIKCLEMDGATEIGRKGPIHRRGTWIKRVPTETWRSLCHNRAKTIRPGRT